MVSWAKEHHKVSRLHDWQMGVIKKTVDGHKHLLVVIPTGGGKTLAFMLPSVVMKKCTLVLCPVTALVTSLVGDLAAGGYTCMALESPEDLPRLASQPCQFGSLSCCESVY